MKLVIESVNDDDIKVTLNWNGKDYSEVWSEKDGMLKTTSPTTINCQMEKDNFCVDNTDLGDILDSVEIDNFMSLSKREKTW